MNTTAPQGAHTQVLTWGNALSVWEIAEQFGIDLTRSGMATHVQQIRRAIADDAKVATLFLRLGINTLVLDVNGCYMPFNITQIDGIIELLVGGPEPKLERLTFLVPTRDALKRLLYTNRPMRVDDGDLMAPSVEIAKHRVTFKSADLHRGDIRLSLKFERLTFTPLKGRHVTEAWEETRTIQEMAGAVELREGTKR